MSKNSSLSKTCSNCGLEKPLTAFLQIAGPEGTMYGNLCASCRSGKIDKGPVEKEPDESTKSSAGLRIDSKAKQQIEKEKHLFLKEKEEKEIKEQEKSKEEAQHKTEKTEKTLSLEKKHRQNFLSSRPAATEKAAPAKAAGGPDKTVAYQQAAASKQDKQQKDAATKADLQAKGHNIAYGQQELPSQTGALIKNQGVAFQSWLRNVVGPNAAMTKAFGVDKQINKTNEKKPEKESTKEEEKDLKTNINETFRRRGR